MPMRRLILFSIVLASIAVAGCNSATDVSAQPSKADLQQADQRRAAGVQDRKDLSPQQRAALEKYYGGGAAGNGKAGRTR